MEQSETFLDKVLGIRQTPGVVFFVESALRILYRHNRQRFDILYVREMERNPVLLLLARFMKCPLFVEVNGCLLDELA